VRLTINAAVDVPVAGSFSTLSFDGIDDRVEVASSIPINEGWKGLTVEAWIRPEQQLSATTNVLVCDENRLFNISTAPDYNTSGRLVFGIGWLGGYGWVAPPVVFPKGEWSHVALCIDAVSNRLSILKNGVEVFAEQRSAGTRPTAMRLRFGSGPPGGAFHGSLDEIRIWSEARPPKVIESQMNRPLAGNEGGLQAYYRLDQVAMLSALDATANQRHGRLINGPEWEVPGAGFPTMSDGLREGLLFNGVDTAINLGNFAITNDQTIEFWIYAEDLTRRQNPIAKAYGGEGTITLETDGRLTYCYGTNGGNAAPYLGYTTPTGVLQSRTWTHVALVRKLSMPRSLTWYVNGAAQPAFPANSSFQPSTAGTNLFAWAAVSMNSWTLGKGYAGAFKGMMSEVRLWSVAQTAAQIRTGMTNVVATNASGLEGYWRLSEASGYAAYDFSTNNRTGWSQTALHWVRLAPALATAPNFQTFEVPEDSPGVNIPLIGTSADSSQVQFVIINSPTRGTFLNSSGAYRTYRPDPDFYGTDSFTYQATIGTNRSAPVTVILKVLDLNDPPIISALMNEVVEEDDPAPTQTFSVRDVDDPVAALTLSATSSNPKLVPPTNIVAAITNLATGHGSVRVIPAPGEIGIARISLTVSDGKDPVTATFDLEVRSSLAFGVIEIPPLAGRNFSAACALNEDGHVAGYSYEGAGDNEAAFHYTGLYSDATVRPLPALSGKTTARAYGINKQLHVTGYSPGDKEGTPRAFVKAPYQDNPIDLGAYMAGTVSRGLAINESGLVIGHVVQNGLSRAFFRATEGSARYFFSQLIGK